MENKIDVKVIKTVKQAALVEWFLDGHIYRGTIPVSEIHENRVDESVLQMAIPYGLPWAELVEMNATPEDLEHELHRRGIWTFDDLPTRMNDVIGALQTVYRTDASALVRGAKAFSSRNTV